MHNQGNSSATGTGIFLEYMLQCDFSFAVESKRIWNSFDETHFSDSRAMLGKQALNQGNKKEQSSRQTSSSQEN